MSDSALHIIEAYEPCVLEQLLAQKKKDVNEYRTVVLGAVRQIFNEQRALISSCLINAMPDRISVVFGTRGTQYAFDLCDVLSEAEIALTDADWSFVDIASLPGEPNEARLRDFSAFALSDVL